MGRCIRRSAHPIVCTIERDGGHGDRRLSRQAAFNVSIGRVAGHQAKTVPVGMDHNVDKIRVVKSCGAAFKHFCVKLPGGRPQCPEQSGQAAAVLGQPSLAALAVKVILIPELMLVFSRIRLHAFGNILDVVAAHGNQSSAAFGPQRSHHAGSAATPVITGQDGTRQTQRIHQRQQICAKGCLFA